MTYNPQIPEWGEKYLDKQEEKLFNYHNWLSTTGIKTGLISQKTDQQIWDEFIVHSLYSVSYTHLTLPTIYSV